MKLVTYTTTGRTYFGVKKGNSIVSLTGRSGAADLKELLAQGGLKEAEALAERTAPDHAIADVKFLPVIPNPDKFFCIGLNYEGHRIETNSPLSAHPQVFTRWNDTLTGHEDVMIRPHGNDTLDYEGELAIVIGKTARHVSEADALSVVAGYCCFNDGSVRDWQKHTSQFTPGKNYPRTGALGPWLVTADEIPDPGSLTLTTRLNGKMMQEDSTGGMTFNCRQVIAYCSAFTELHPGDVIVTGTPSGVGYRRTPPVFMRPGDVVEVEISGLGVLRNHIRDERV